MSGESQGIARRGWLYVALTIVAVLGLWFAVVTAFAVAKARAVPAIVCGLLTVIQALLFARYLRSLRHPGR